MTIVEDYCKVDAEEIPSVAAALRKEQEAWLAQAKDLGLTAQIEKAKTAHRFIEATTFFEHLTGSTLRHWRKFLPTTNAPQDYQFNMVPAKVLELMAFARECKVFDRLEVWSPEGSSYRDRITNDLKVGVDKLGTVWDEHIDPMLVGVIEHNGRDHIFAIARWAEADISYEQVMTTNYARDAAVIGTKIVLPAALLLALYLLLSFAAGFGAIALGGTITVLLAAAMSCASKQFNDYWHPW